MATKQKATPTHDEAGVPLPAPIDQQVLSEDHPRLKFTHDRGGSPISPFDKPQDIEQPVEWKIGKEKYDNPAEADQALADARAAAQAKGDDPDEVELQVSRSEITHDPQGRPKPAFAEGVVEDPPGDETVVERASTVRTIRGHRDRIDSQANAAKRAKETR